MRIAVFAKAIGLSFVLATMLSGGVQSARAQSPQTSLPANYKTTFENDDLLVMQVHYAPHEFVPMHDHTAYPTLFVYLTNSGEVHMTHEGANGFRAQRPPTEAGAFRFAPGMVERHSVTSLSDTESAFLRVELKQLPVGMEKRVFREETPLHLVPGMKTEYQDKALRIDRILCAAMKECALSMQSEPSVLIAISTARVKIGTGERELKAGDVIWLPAKNASLPRLGGGAHYLRVSLLYAK